MGYCSQCAAPIPGDQKICSMCYGDPDYGKDGYYQAELDRAEEDERRKYEEQRQAEADDA